VGSQWRIRKNHPHQSTGTGIEIGAGTGTGIEIGTGTGIGIEIGTGIGTGVTKQRTNEQVTHALALKKSNRIARMVMIDRIIRMGSLVTKTQSHVGWNTRTLWNVGFKQRRRVTWDGTQGRYGTWDSNKDAESRGMEHKDAMERPFNTEAQRHRNTEGRIEHRTQNDNLFFEFYVQFFPLCFCASVPLCLCVEWAFHSVLVFHPT
jgi:hypothetical protein